MCTAWETDMPDSVYICVQSSYLCLSINSLLIILNVMIISVTQVIQILCSIFRLSWSRCLALPPEGNGQLQWNFTWAFLYWSVVLLNHQSNTVNAFLFYIVYNYLLQGVSGDSYAMLFYAIGWHFHLVLLRFVFCLKVFFLWHMQVNFKKHWLFPLLIKSLACVLTQGRLPQNACLICISFDFPYSL